jgi:hypothetical protein
MIGGEGAHHGFRGDALEALESGAGWVAVCRVIAMKKLLKKSATIGA